MIFVDTNYFLRFLIKDNKEQFQSAQKLFLDGVNGNLSLTTTSVVMLEIYYVLKTYYQKSKTEICEILHNVLKMTFIKIDERNILIQAVKFFNENNLSLEDCYNLFWARENKLEHFKTFDTKLAKIFNSTVNIR